MMTKGAMSALAFLRSFTKAHTSSCRDARYYFTRSVWAYSCEPNELAANGGFRPPNGDSGERMGRPRCAVNRDKSIESGRKRIPFSAVHCVEPSRPDALGLEKFDSKINCRWARSKTRLNLLRISAPSTPS